MSFLIDVKLKSFRRPKEIYDEDSKIKKIAALGGLTSKNKQL